MIHFAYQSLYSTPNNYPFIYVNIPTQSFIERNGTTEKIFPISNFYPDLQKTKVTRIPNPFVGFYPQISLASKDALTN